MPKKQRGNNQKDESCQQEKPYSPKYLKRVYKKRTRKADRMICKRLAVEGLPEDYEYPA